MESCQEKKDNIQKIPVIILSKDEPDFLKQTVLHLIERTKYPYELFIVDNNSKSKEQLELLNELSNKYRIIKNKSNQWVLGFNSALQIVKNPIEDHLSKEFFVLSDGDIIVPDISIEQKCWLTLLVNGIKEFPMIGKIGLSLNLSKLKNIKSLHHIYNQESRYLNGIRFNEFIIAPTDTTLALYRSDIFIHRPYKIMPGHNSMIKPHYYSVRTSENLTAIHLGWDNYSAREPLNKEQIRQKIITFTIYAAHIDKRILAQAGSLYELFYSILKPIFKIYWGLNVIANWTIFLLKRFPRNINELQSKHR